MTTQRLIEFLSSCDPEAEVQIEHGASGENYLVIGKVAYTRKDIENPLAAPLAPWVGQMQFFDMPDEQWDQLPIKEKLEKHEEFLAKSATERFDKYQWDEMIQGPGGGQWGSIPTATLEQIRNIKFPIFNRDPEQPKGRVGASEIINGKLYDTDDPSTVILFQYEVPAIWGGPFYNAEMCIDKDGEIFLAGSPAEPHWDARIGRTILVGGGGIVVLTPDRARQFLSQHGEPGLEALQRMEAILSERK